METHNMIMDRTGMKIGRLFVESKIKEDDRWVYKCRCDCGNEVTKKTDYFRKENENTASCGCYSKDFNRERVRKDIKDEKFGRLLVLDEFYEENRRNQIKWICLCDCGNISIVRGDHLRRGITVSCECYKKEKATTHGKTNDRIYRIWRGMIRRCYYKNDISYHNYGGKGIKVCDRWLESFENFYEDMGDPEENMTLDRINSSDSYYKENCKWSTMKEQQRNRGNNLKIEYNGNVISLSELAESLGIENYDAFRARISNGWTLDQSLGLEPKNGKFYKHPDMIGT